jgi:hypothetical protein
MVLRKLRITVPKMNSVFALAQTLERREKAKVGSVGEARRSLASKLQIGIGTFENLVRERVKACDGRIRDRLQALLVSELEAEIKRLTHELEIARQSGAPLNSDEVGEIETHLAKARALLMKN